MAGAVVVGAACCWLLGRLAGLWLWRRRGERLGLRSLERRQMWTREGRW